MALSNDKKLIAAGHESGTVRIWDLETMSLKITFHGHKSAVSCLKFNKSNNLLISGGRDCNVVVWDIIGEMGLYRLQGHKDMITGVALLEKSNRLITSSKDTYIKLWQLETQHCVQTVCNGSIIGLFFF